MTEETEMTMRIYRNTIMFIVVAFAVTVISLNLIWINFFNQYNFTSTAETTIVQQDGQGVNVYTDNNSESEVNYGTESD